MQCVICHKSLENLDEDGFQPLKGLAFHTYGHYGSQKFDPMDGSYLELAICDDCLVETALQHNVKYGIPQKPKPILQTWKITN